MQKKKQNHQVKEIFEKSSYALIIKNCKPKQKTFLIYANSKNVNYFPWLKTCEKTNICCSQEYK